MARFSETIAGAPAGYLPYYLKYDQLLEFIQELASKDSDVRRRLGSRDFENEQQPVGRFQEILQSELQKVNQFSCVKHEDLFLGLRRLCEECKKLGKKREDIESMERRIEALGDEVVHFDTYVRLNYLGFTKITQKFDGCLGVSGSSLFVAGLQSEPFCNVRFDDILILSGLCWARWRNAQSAVEQSKDATWKPPECFIRNTSKYWVRPEKVVMLKTRIIRELPYLLFGASTLDQEKLLEPFALLDLDYDSLDAPTIGAYSGTLEESQLLSSVYFDSPDAVSYRSRIRREEGARLVRFRWYGENDFSLSKEIFVERKIHHEGWGGKSSAKERCILQQSDIFPFMKGKFDIDAFYKRLEAEGMYSSKARKMMKGICDEVSEMIQEKKLQPIIRTSYYRCAFQLATSNDVRISLDTQMTMLNEFAGEGHPNAPWCKTSNDLLNTDEICRFPFAILEIKLQNVSEAPEWLKQTLADIGAIQVHKFSKFQHAMAFLHPQRVPIMPHWHKDFQDWDEQRNIQAAATTRGDRLESFEDMTVPHVRAEIARSGVGHELKDMENLDPKAFFAAERTLLHYAEKGMLVGAAGVASIYQGGPFAIAGWLLVIIVLAFYMWMLREYYSRLTRIRSSASMKNSLLRLDLEHGPIIVGLLIMAVLVITLFNTVVRLQQEDLEPTSS